MATATKTGDSASNTPLIGKKKLTNGQKKMVNKLNYIGVNTDEILRKVVWQNIEQPTGKCVRLSEDQKEKLTQLLRDAVSAYGIENLKVNKKIPQHPTVPLGKSSTNTKCKVKTVSSDEDAHIAKKLKVDEQTSEQPNRRLKENRTSASEKNTEPSNEQILGEILVLGHPGTIPDSESEDD